MRLFYLERVGLLISVTVTITLFCIVVLAKVVGGLLPIAAKSVKLDPAIMASPLITTMVDSIALIIFFTIASVLLVS